MNYISQSRRKSMLNGLIQAHTSREKRNDGIKQHPISNVDLGSSCLIGMDHAEHGSLEDRAFRIVEWRKSTREPIVAVRSYNFSMIKTSSKPIHVPTAIQAEKILQRLDELKELPISEALLVVSSLISGYSAIRKFLGFATFCLRFCGVNGEGKVKAWINSDLQMNEPEGQPINDESEFVLKIMQAVKKISASQFLDFYSYYLRNASKNICDFKYMLSLLRSYCQCTKHKIATQIQISNSSKQIHHANSSSEHSENLGISLKKSSRYSLNPAQCVQKEASLSIFSAKKSNDVELPKKFSLKSIQAPRFAQNSRLQDSKTFMEEKAEQQEDTPGNRTERQPLSATPKEQISYLSPKFSYTSTIINSQTSTENTNSNRKSNQLKNSNEWGFTTFNKFNNLPSTPKNTSSQNALYIKGYEKKKVSALESLYQNPSQRKNDGISARPRVKTHFNGKDSLQELQEKGEEIIKQNQWTNRIDDLFASSQLKESRVLGQEPVLAPSSQPSTFKLDKWARVIRESNLPSHY